MGDSAYFLCLLGEGLLGAITDVFHLRKQLCLWNSVLFLFGFVKYFCKPVVFARADVDTEDC